MNKRHRILTAICSVCLILGSMTPMISYADTERKITKQPTVSQPAVGVNDTEGAAYQWYEAAYEKRTDVVDLAGEIRDGKMLATVNNDDHLGQDGTWYSQYDVISMNIALKDGDTLQVIPSEEFNGSVKMPGYGITLTDENGVYSYTASRDMKPVYLVLYGEEDFTAQIQVIRDDITYLVVSSFGQIYENQISADTSLGMFKDDKWTSNQSYELRLSVYVQKGQVIQVTLSEGFSGNISIDWQEMTGSGTYYYVAAKNNHVWIEILGDAVYTADICICDMLLGQPMEGQTTDTLTEAEQGTYYACKVTYPDGEELISSFVQAQQKINKQPTTADPTVGVNYGKGASYQWYKTGEVTYNLVDGNVIAGDNERYMDTVYIGTYDSTVGMWCGEYYYGLDLEVSMKAGEKLIVTPEEGFEGTIAEYGSDESFTEESDGVYVYTASKDEYMNFVVRKDDDGVPYAKVELVAIDKTEAVEGETSSTLTDGTYGESYICNVSWENGVTEDSIAVTLIDAITKQPTGSEPGVSVNFPDNVAGYQWYGVTAENLKITYRAGEIKDDVMYVSSHDGNYADGVWTSESRCISMYFTVEAGDTILIAPTGAEGDAEYYLQGYTSENVTIEEDNEYITCTIEENFEDDDPFYLQFYADGEFSLTAHVKKADGTVYTVEPYDYEANQEIEVQYVNGSCEDGIWTSMEYSYIDAHMIGLDLNLKEGDRVIVKPSEGFTGMVMAGSYNATEPTYLSEENGVYTYEVALDDEHAIMIIDHEKEATAEIFVERVSLTDAIDGQTTSDLISAEPGLYSCVVTLKDGTTLVSDYVEITEDDIPDDPVPENPEGDSEGDSTGDRPSIPNKGDSCDIICYALLLMTGIAIIAAGFIARRRVR